MIAVRGMTVRLGGRIILDGVDFTARDDSVSVILGPNGAGKSTLLKALLGLMPYEGSAQVYGREVRSFDPAERARALAYVPQRSRLQCEMSVENVVAMGRFAHQNWLSRLGPADHTAIARALEQTDAAALSARHFNELSCGEQQRVLIARALASEAPAILLDEPTASLDIAHVLTLLALLRRLAAQGKCIVVVLHQLEEARQCADRCLLLHQGKVIACGDVAAVIADAPLRKAYGVEAVRGGATGFKLIEGSPGSSP
jgi:iron complex transport system ATP-binding protein